MLDHRSPRLGPTSAAGVNDLAITLEVVKLLMHGKCHIPPCTAQVLARGSC